MHGREGEKKRLFQPHMWPPTSTSTSTLVQHSPPISPSHSFHKGGRKIRVGDCALFKPPQDSPPFVGIIRRLIVGEDDILSLRVNWLYRPADVKLGKGVVLEAAPNEVFYSFHKDEIPAASLLHPCKVAFLRKGVQLPSGLPSFVCRRVYDIENKCLWWLTDQDYINSCSTQERQLEVDQLLDKTRLEMYGAVQSGGRSPKPLNGATGSQQLKSGTDSVKGKKREFGAQSSDPLKRERLEHSLKSEIAKITDNRGLMDFEGVEKFVQLMQPDRAEKKLDLSCRIVLVDVIAVTDRFDCLGRFVQLKGLSALDEWLQEAHKGKIGDGSSPKESDKSADEFLLALLRALDKLPVNLHALQTCNVGKSVNYLRTHKNCEIQKKARSLVDTWKKRVEAEMNVIDAKTGSTRSGSWPNKSVISEVSHVGSRQNGGASEVGVKSLISQLACASKAPSVKVGSGDTVGKFSPASPGSTKLSFPATTSGVCSTNDPSSVTAVGGGSAELLLSAIKEEKTSSSSQSQNNSQACSSDNGKTGDSCREDAHNRKSSNGLQGSAVSRGQKETSFGKIRTLSRNLASEKESPTRGTSERSADVTFLDNGNSQRLIVRLPNMGLSPTQSASGGSPEDASATFCKGSPLAHSEKLDMHDWKVKGKSDVLRVNIGSNANKDLFQGKDGLARLDEVNGEVDERHTEASKATGSSSETTPNLRKLYDPSFSSINALVESCVKFSEASASVSVGDDIGMNLLASVAAGEISRSDVSPLDSPARKSLEPEGSCSGNNVKTDEDGAQSENGPNDVTNGPVTVDEDCYVDSLGVRSGSQHEVKTAEHTNQLNSPCIDLPQNGSGPFLPSDGKPTSSAKPTKDGNIEGEGADQLTSSSVSNSKSSSRSLSFDEDKKVISAEEIVIGNSLVVLQGGDTSTKLEPEVTEDSTSCLSSYVCGDDKKMMQKQSGNSIIMEQQVMKAESANDMKSGIQNELHEKQKMDIGLSVLDHCSDNPQENLKKEEILGHCLGGLAPSRNLPASPVREAQKGVKSSGCKSDGEEEPASVSVSDMTVKLDFDLNEVLPVEDGNIGDLVKCSVPENLSSVYPPFSISGSLSGMITVAAAAKGPFVPPENPLRSKGELGWKGSAATSAFRPAEPRRVTEMPFSRNSVLIGNSISKQGRPLLDFDLNVPDDRVLEDASQSSASVTCLKTGSRDGIGGGLNLDLNRCDESPEIGQFPVSSSCRFEIPKLPGRSPLSGGFSNAVLNGSRNFDLNDGPGVDESGGETAAHARSSMPFLSPVPGVRMNNMEMGSFPSWFSPTSSYSAIALSPILHGRSEQSYPIVPAGGSQRILGPPNASEVYRGAVLSSSPAVPFPTAAPFQYPGFPFETKFSVSPNSYPGVSTAYIDSSSAGALCFPAIPTGMVTTHYPRPPYVMTLPGGTSNVGPESRKWGSQGLDLNAGPGGTDVERRDERLPSALRQLSVAGSQAAIDEQLKMYQMGGGVLKRKEPDGGWDGGDRISCKHPSWQ